MHINKRASLSDRYSMHHYDGLSFDALFGSMYDSEKDEDYSVKEDLIQNTKTYQNDFKPFKHNVSKAEIAYLKSQQKFDSLLFATGFDQQANEGFDGYLPDPLRFEAPSEGDYRATDKFFGEDDDVDGVIGVRGRGTRSQLLGDYGAGEPQKRRRHEEEMKSETNNPLP